MRMSIKIHFVMFTRLRIRLFVYMSKKTFGNTQKKKRKRLCSNIKPLICNYSGFNCCYLNQPIAKNPQKLRTLMQFSSISNLLLVGDFLLLTRRKHYVHFAYSEEKRLATKRWHLKCRSDQMT